MKNFLKKMIVGLVLVLTIASVSTVAFAVDYDDPPKATPTVAPVEKE